MPLLIDKSVFDDYFNQSYKFEYLHLVEPYSVYEGKTLVSEEDYEQMDLVTKTIKEKIKLVFEKAIESNQYIPLKHKFNKLEYTNFIDDYSTIDYSSSWIKTTNKIVLYNYLLFEPTDKLSQCIDFWFPYNIGYYFNDESRGYKERICIDDGTNIQLIDSIGSALKSHIKFESTRYLTNPQEIDEFNFKRDEIFTYKLNTKLGNYTKYKHLINSHQQINPDFPTIHIGEQGQEQLDLIELFDVFLGIKEDSSIWFNPKKYTSMWIESSDEIFVDLD